jgi:signal peptide peptidase SppA
MRYPLIATQLYGIPLLIHPDKAAVIETVFRSHADGTPVQFDGAERPEPMAVAYQAERFANKSYVVTDGGVGVLPITGSLVHRGGFIDALSGMQSYQSLEKKATAMAVDPDVKAILLEMDSPGGQAAGVFDLAKKMKEACAAAGKPLWAAVNETAMSAAYALASVADRVTMAKTGAVGSIGVIALHVDQSKKNAKDGYTYTAIHAGSKKTLGTPHAPLTDEAKSEIQARVDEMYDHFIDHVAQMRGVEADAVRAQEARTFSGQAAIDAGLVDELMSFNETLAALEAEVSAKPFSTAATYPKRQSITKGNAMGKETQADQLTAEQVAAQVAAAKAEGATQMQARIRDIQTCDEAKGREKLASHLSFSTSMSVDEAKALLAASAVEVATTSGQASALAAGMAKLTNPAVGSEAAAATDPNPQAEAAAVWNRSNAKLLRVK